MSSKWASYFINYSTLNSKHNRVVLSQGINKICTFRYPQLNHGSRSDFHASATYHKFADATQISFCKSKPVEVGGGEKGTKQHSHSLLQPIPGQHVYDIKRSDQHVARTACYSLYSLCSCPVKDILTHQQEIGDGELHSPYLYLRILWWIVSNIIILECFEESTSDN